MGVAQRMSNPVAGDRMQVQILPPTFLARDIGVVATDEVVGLIRRVQFPHVSQKQSSSNSRIPSFQVGDESSILSDCIKKPPWSSKEWTPDLQSGDHMGSNPIGGIKSKVLWCSGNHGWL